MSMANNKSLLVVLPVLNELRNLEILLPAIWKLYPWMQILIIDDDSQDGTENYLKSLIASKEPISYMRRHKKLGIGNAHLAGLEYAQTKNFDYVVTMDADLTHRPGDLQRFLDSSRDADLIIGSRYLNDSNMSGWSLFRKLLTKSGHFVTSVAFFRNWDMSSGMRLYNTRLIPINLLRLNCPNDYAFFFISAITYKKIGLKVKQVPIQLDQRQAGKSKMTFSLMFVGTKLLGLYALRIKRIRIH